MDPHTTWLCQGRSPSSDKPEPHRAALITQASRHRAESAGQTGAPKPSTGQKGAPKFPTPEKTHVGTGRQEAALDVLSASVCYGGVDASMSTPHMHTIHMCTPNTHPHVYTPEFTTYPHMHTLTNTPHTYTHLHTHILNPTSTHLHVYTHIYIPYVHTPIYTNPICTHTHTCTHPIYAHSYMYTYAYTRMLANTCY